MILSYNTNGFAHHSLDQAITVLASLGYRGVAITIDHGALCPFEASHLEQLASVRRLLMTHGITPVIETGARFLLDPFEKHQPSMVSATEVERGERLAFYRYAIDVAVELGAACVSLWSGAPTDDADRPTALDRLADSLGEVVHYATERKITLGLEPEPGMTVATLNDYREVKQRLDAPANLRLTLDVGHLLVTGEAPVADRIRGCAGELVNVHIEDMKPGVHEHLMFGEGEIDFPTVIHALQETGYTGPLSVELSRHSHQAPDAARRAAEFLLPLIA